MGTVSFVLGGIRSGKSRFAQELADTESRARGTGVLYVATAQAHDQEMRDRIARHQADRPASWRTVEAPLSAAGALRQAERDYSVILIDCLSFLITNLILTLGEEPDSHAAEDLVRSEMDRLLPVAKSVDGHVIIVSNEVGIGLVAPYRLGRVFQDVVGRAHQRVAAQADAVYFMIAGIPQRIK